MYISWHLELREGLFHLETGWFSFRDECIDHNELERDCEIVCLCTSLSTLTRPETKQFFGIGHLFESRKPKGI